MMFHGGAYEIAKKELKTDIFGMIPFGDTLITIPAMCNEERYNITVNIAVHRIESVQSSDWCLHCYSEPKEEYVSYGRYYFVTGNHEQFENEWAMLVLKYY